MLTSITPLGEQGRGNTYALTVTAYLLGSVLGGATTGAALGAVGALVAAPLPGPARLLLAALVCAVAAAADAVVLRTGRRLPGGRRQVDEDWLTRYRGWVYGGAFGFQLGLGVVTIVTSAATFALLALVVLSGGPAPGLALGPRLRARPRPAAARPALGAQPGGAAHGRPRGRGPFRDGRTGRGRRAGRRRRRARRRGGAGMRLAARGISVDVPDGWETRLRTQAPSVAWRPGNTLLHACTRPLPAERGDFGTGVVDLLGPDDVFVSLFEYDPEHAGTALFEVQGLPVVRPSEFSPNATQRPLPGQSGGQWFFTRRRPRLLPVRRARQPQPARRRRRPRHRPAVPAPRGGLLMTRTATALAALPTRSGPTAPPAGLAQRTTDAVTGWLARRTSRRGFLVRAGVVGSALAVDPTGYVLRPGTAYAAVCGPGASCSSGWTVFCATVNKGVNACPPGSIAAGWWKMDGASLCGGSGPLHHRLQRHLLAVQHGRHRAGDLRQVLPVVPLHLRAEQQLRPAPGLLQRLPLRPVQHPGPAGRRGAVPGRVLHPAVALRELHHVAGDRQPDRRPQLLRAAAPATPASPPATSRSARTAAGSVPRSTARSASRAAPRSATRRAGSPGARPPAPGRRSGRSAPATRGLGYEGGRLRFPLAAERSAAGGRGRYQEFQGGRVSWSVADRRLGDVRRGRPPLRRARLGRRPARLPAVRRDGHGRRGATSASSTAASGGAAAPGRTRRTARSAGGTPSSAARARPARLPPDRRDAPRRARGQFSASSAAASPGAAPPERTRRTARSAGGTPSSASRAGPLGFPTDGRAGRPRAAGGPAPSSTAGSRGGRARVALDGRGDRGRVRAARRRGRRARPGPAGRGRRPRDRRCGGCRSRRGTLTYDPATGEVTRD